MANAVVESSPPERRTMAFLLSGNSFRPEVIIYQQGYSINLKTIDIFISLQPKLFRPNKCEIFIYQEYFPKALYATVTEIAH